MHPLIVYWFENPNVTKYKNFVSSGKHTGKVRQKRNFPFLDVTNEQP